MTNQQLAAKPRRTIDEVSIIRVIACLSVVLLHSIKFSTGDSSEGAIQFGLWSLAGLLSFGTSTFVFISALILAYSYPKQLPNGFYAKRIRFLLIPFACMAIFYAIVSGLTKDWSIPKLVVYNLLGAYHGWFVLVIFQFYVLHQLYAAYIDRFRPAVVLGVSLFVNVLYLGFFNLVPPPAGGLAAYIWERGYWMPFTGWLFYFSLAYYCGRHYELFLRGLERYKLWIIAALPLTAGWVVYNNAFSSLGFGSKRVDMIGFTVVMILLLFLLLRGVKRIPPFVTLISQYSFGIYLVHWFFLEMMDRAIERLGIALGYAEIPLLFVAGIACCIVTIWVFNHMVPFGQYVVGRINTGRSVRTQASIRTTTTHSTAAENG
ncbi:acyltransferase family protein [Paenibacillus sp. SGZ-1009]|uniref:acyltransferase family protein n=1 Tax=Paenibacillus campi TaxID=3106031 RepID=UPI002AFF002C|nr:acyltransferase family protein [Paenibacillus sp. SGZ-1009]